MTRETDGIYADETEPGVAAGKRQTAEDKYVNNTSRLRKFTCNCETHITNADTGKESPGPYIIRAAGSCDLLARCDRCGGLFQLEDTPARRRLYRGCRHCTSPEDHEHGSLDDDGGILADPEEAEED